MKLAPSVVAFLLVAAVATAQPNTLDSVLEKARVQVESVERALSTAVADELYVQTGDVDKNLGGSGFGVTGQGGSGMVETSTARVTRKSIGELLLVRDDRVPAGWAGLRDILQVDSTTVRSKDGRLDALAAQSVEAVVRNVAMYALEAHKHKVGEPREFCVPTAALGLLRRSVTGLKWQKAGEEKVAGVQAWKLAFSGNAPGVIVGRPGADALLRGTFWVDPADGRILRTRVESGERLDAYQFRVEVTYAQDAALGALVPTEMKERFEGPGTKVDGKATYSRFRRPAGVAK